MSALVVPPSPRLYAMSVVLAQEAAAQCYEGEAQPSTGGRAQRQERSMGEVCRRGHLRLVTADFVPIPALAEVSDSSSASLPRVQEKSDFQQFEETRAATVIGSQSRPDGQASVKGSVRTGTDDSRRTSANCASSDVLAAVRERSSVRMSAQREMAMRGTRLLESMERQRDTVRLHNGRASSALMVQTTTRASRRGSLSPVTVTPASAGLPAPISRVLAIVGGMVAAALLLAGGIVLSGLTSLPAAEQTVVVQSGESLWDIAAASGSPDVARTVAYMIDINDLDGSTIHPGQTLRVPSN